MVVPRGSGIFLLICSITARAVLAAAPDAPSVKGGMTASTLRFTSVSGQPTSLIMGNATTGEVSLTSNPENGEFSLISSSLSIMSIKSDSSIEFTCPQVTVQRSLDIQGDLFVSETPQWRIAHIEDFTTKQSIGWDNTNLDLITECAGIFMLGGYGKFSKGEISKQFPGLPPHSMLRVKATFHFIDAWVGETGFMRMNVGKDGSLVHVWTDKHNQNTEQYSVNVCGSGVGEGKFAVPIDITVPHSQSSIILAFGSTIETDDPTDESWGISGIEIYVR